MILGGGEGRGICDLFFFFFLVQPPLLANQVETLPLRDCWEEGSPITEDLTGKNLN